MASLSLIRAMTVVACFVVFQALTLNHFVYALLKDRYVIYQVTFYAILFGLSLLVSPPWSVSRNRFAVVSLLCGVGYLSSLIDFWIEPLIRFGSLPSITGSRGYAFYRELVLAPLFSLGWLFGLAIGIAIVTMERPLISKVTLR